MFLTTSRRLQEYTFFFDFLKTTRERRSMFVCTAIITIIFILSVNVILKKDKINRVAIRRSNHENVNADKINFHRTGLIPFLDE